MSVTDEPTRLPPYLPEDADVVREPAADGELRLRVALADFPRISLGLRDLGARFVTLMLSNNPARAIVGVFALRGDIVAVRADLDDGPLPDFDLRGSWPAVSWAELELLERHGTAGRGPADRPRLTVPDAGQVSRATAGADVFVLPLGPVRSGIYEAIQFVIETGGESVPRLQTRPFFKYRGLEARMVGLPVAKGIHVAERIAGIASVAYATAYCHAVERSLGVEPPVRATHWRALYAELERIACHADVLAREAEAAALYVAQARFLVLKEQILQLRSELTGSRFGRGVVVPGGVAFEGRMELSELHAAVDRFERDIRRDWDLFVGTASMSDRLIGSGVVSRTLVEDYSAVGPVARGSGASIDARHERPYGAFARTGLRVVTARGGDAMARVAVRFGEILESLHVIRQCIEMLCRRNGPLAAALPSHASGAEFGWAEAPQGELVVWTEIRDGMICLAHVASPSFRNFALFERAFPDDVLTDFAFIEHSFGLTPAGVDR